jgi:hypothetical protein
VGGIRHQIRDGENGFLVSSVEETAERIVRLVNNRNLRERLGKEARRTVEANFLLTRLLEQYLDLFNSFETIHRLRTLRQKSVQKTSTRTEGCLPQQSGGRLVLGGFRGPGGRRSWVRKTSLSRARNLQRGELG